MSDSHTQQALEELARLYLTEPDTADPAEGGSAAEAPAAPAPWDLDAAATLDRDEPMRAAAAAPIEAVLLGHLPGYASPWISQYAHRAAREHGGAALLRVGEGGVELERFEAEVSDQHPPLTEDEILPGGVAEQRSAQTLAEALREAGARVGAWLVALDRTDDEAGRERLAMLPRWTLLSSADDAAVVGAYRLLKGLLDRDDVRPPHEGIGVMFVGCDREQASAALERLNRAASAFLRVPVEMVAVHPRIEPVRRRGLGRFELAEGSDAWAELVRMLQEGSEASAQREMTEALRFDEGSPTQPGIKPQAESAQAEEPDEQAPGHDFRGRGPHITASIDRVRPVPSPRPTEQEQGAAPDVAGAGMEEAFEAERPIREAPSSDDSAAAAFDVSTTSGGGPQANTSGGGGGASGGDRLAAFLPDACPIEARCPRQPAVQLAVDRAGRLHVMVHATGSVARAVRRLYEARRWAAEHRSLLAMTCREQHLDERAEPIAHLFSADPTDALELAFAGAAEARDLHLHLLKPVTVAGRTVCVHQQLY